MPVRMFCKRVILIHSYSGSGPLLRVEAGRGSDHEPPMSRTALAGAP